MFYSKRFLAVYTPILTTAHLDMFTAAFRENVLTAGHK
jgi:hypothetical protein